LPEVSEPTKRWQQRADTLSFSNPTLAMLEIMSKMRQKATTPAHQGGMCRLRPLVQPPKECACDDNCRPLVVEVD
jgi:hypothetical protein